MQMRRDPPLWSLGVYRCCRCFHRCSTLDTPSGVSPALDPTRSSLASADLGCPRCTGAQLEAGSAIAATSVAVMSGGSNKPLRSYVLAGVRTSLTVVQTLRYHPHPEADAAGDAADAAAAVAASTAKSRRRGRHNPDGSGGSARGDAIGSDEGEVVLCVRNPTPIQNSFQFEPLCNGLKHAGRYSLELSVEQLPHVKVTCDIRVRAGALAGVALDSPPAQLSARLGGPLGPDLRLLLLDAFQNVMESVKEAPAISFDLLCAATGDSLSFIFCLQA
jgi:hypothetical protein